VPDWEFHILGIQNISLYKTSALREAAFINSFSVEGAVTWAHAVDCPGVESSALGVTSSGVAVMTLAGMPRSLGRIFLG
jgi:hypothetical protein